MKFSAELALKQSLIITEDMRLAINMLAMTNIEIDDVIDEELLKNPCLEEDEHYLSNKGNDGSIFADASSGFDIALETKSPITDFRSELLRGVGENSFNSIERDIAYHLINNLDDDGLLIDPHHVYADIALELGVFAEWIETVRLRIMDLEPLGCCALDIAESLQHQSRKKSCYPHREFFELLQAIKCDPAHKLSLARLSRIKDDQEVFRLRELKTRPGSAFSEKNFVIEIIYPDVLVKTEKTGLIVSLTKKSSDRLVIKNTYREQHNSFLRDNQKRALFMMKALRYREVSLVSVSKAIVDHQQAWLLEKGPLLPLNQREIANVCGLHVSSVSRLTKGKYLMCDRGIFELKYFFSAKLLRDAHESHSASTVKHHIHQIVSKEDKKNPLSDQKIVERLKEYGLLISRRTVAKYRDSLRLKNAQFRRSLF